jgi:SPX domain protein involved in polyphosphate accumulation
LTQYIRSVNRYELKYLIRHEMVPEFIGSLDGYVYTDPNCNGEEGYQIYSVYCDSADLSLFWEKIEGIKFRRKVRFRRYGDDSDVFLEIKQRINRTLQKRRVRWPLDQVVRTFHLNGVVDGIEDECDPVTGEVLFLWHHYGLRPRMAISYQRRAFFAVIESDLRITFDARVQYHARDFDIKQPLEIGKYLVEPELVIMEIKFSDSVPRWLCKLVRRYSLRHVRLSKYCAGVDREYFKGRLT